MTETEMRTNTNKRMRQGKNKRQEGQNPTPALSTVNIAKDRRASFLCQVSFASMYPPSPPASLDESFASINWREAR